jgi:hypothetical protein
MNNHNFLARYHEEIITALKAALLALALFGCRLWITFPFNCGPEECGISFHTIYQNRLELFVTFAPFAAFILAFALVFMVRYHRRKAVPFSFVGMMALTWLVISFFGLVFNPVLGLIFIPIGPSISILMIATNVISKLKGNPNTFQWGDLTAILLNIAWSGFCYLVAIRFFEAFGD